MGQKSRGNCIIGILILAFLLRLFVVLILFGKYLPASDAADWHEAAQNILAGNGLIYDKGFRAYRSPLPAFYFASVYWIAGVSISAVQIANVLLGVFTVWLSYDLVERTFGSRSAFYAALLVSFHPLLLLYTGQLLSETPVIFLLTLALWLAWLLRNQSLRWMVLLGTVLGLAVLTREIMLPIALLIAVWIIFSYRAHGYTRRVLLASTMLAFVALTLAPWTLRNYWHFGRFMPLTSKGGLSLWIANNPLADGTGTEKVLPIPELQGLPEGELSSVYQRIAVQFIVENPSRFIKLCFRRFVYFWHVQYHGEGVKEIGFLVLHYIILGLAIVGAWRGWRTNPHAVLLFTIVPTSLTLVHMVFLPEGRYRLPADLIMCIFAGTGAAWIVRRTEKIGTEVT